MRIVEVGPRDGLQNESAIVPVDTRVALILALADAGLRSIEAGSFVSPRHVPQMADTEAVLTRLPPRAGVRYPVLVPNMRGLERALEAGVREIAVFAAASDAFSERNIGCTVSESLDRYAPVVARARDAGMDVRGYVSCVLGCPYEGVIDPTRVASVAGALAGMGCYEISLGDTIGVGTPLQAARMLKTVARAVPMGQLALHFHDTYGQALANIVACLPLGVAVLDSAVAGLGGCPYARGATGNVATEDLVYMLNGMKIETGVDLTRLCEAGEMAARAVGRATNARVGRVRAAARLSPDSSGQADRAPP